MAHRDSLPRLEIPRHNAQRMGSVAQCIAHAELTPTVWGRVSIELHYGGKNARYILPRHATSNGD